MLVAIKNPLCKFVSKVECNHDFMVVLILDKRLFKFDKNILFITAYVPPYSTRYSSIDLFSKISNIILNYDPEDYYHLVVGDFNAHTGVESDIVTFDDNIIRTLDLDNDIIARLEINHYMDLLDIPIDRSSVDQMADRGNYGEALLDICRNNLLCIFNGRVGEDRHVGKATTIDNSLIDYVIGSPYLLSKVKSFCVNDFDNFFSDKHCRIEWKFSGNRQCPVKSTSSSPPPAPDSNGLFFDSSKIHLFLNNIDKTAISYLIENFDNLTVNQTTDRIKQILISGANETFQKYRPKPNTSGKYPCYTNKARKLTREYRRARNINNNKKSDATAATLQAKSRACRKEILNVRTISRKKVIKLLRDLKDKAPRHYWRILKSCKESPLMSHYNLLRITLQISL